MDIDQRAKKEKQARNGHQLTRRSHNHNKIGLGSIEGCYHTTIATSRPHLGAVGVSVSSPRGWGRACCKASAYREREPLLCKRQCLRLASDGYGTRRA